MLHWGVGKGEEAKGQKTKGNEDGSFALLRMTSHCGRRQGAVVSTVCYRLWGTGCPRGEQGETKGLDSPPARGMTSCGGACGLRFLHCVQGKGGKAGRQKAEGERRKTKGNEDGSFTAFRMTRGGVAQARARGVHGAGKGRWCCGKNLYMYWWPSAERAVGLGGNMF